VPDRRGGLRAAACGLAIALALGACGGSDTSGGSEDPEGEFRQEDPTLSDERDDGAGNGEESNQPSDNGSGTGSGRGDG
jgi:hypothetical protein